MPNSRPAWLLHNPSTLPKCTLTHALPHPYPLPTYFPSYSLTPRYYTTPKSYLDLINLYLQLLREKREEYTVAKDRLLNGLYKLNETNALVDGMKAELAELAPVIEAKAASTAELLIKVGSIPWVDGG